MAADVLGILYKGTPSSSTRFNNTLFSELIPIWKISRGNIFFVFTCKINSKQSDLF